MDIKEKTNDIQCDEAPGKEQDRPLISICCLSFNHEKYIGEALDSFLRQDIESPVEILIHDDASTDGTRAIIEDYASRYENIIPMYEEENQYSRGIHNLSGVFNFPRARGKYIAMCEGDDFWLDIRKLRIQADFMEAHPECSMCCHAARIVSMDDSFRELARLAPYHNDQIVEPESLISKSVNIPTASLFFRTEYARKLPDWYFDCPVGDIPLQLFMLLCGSVYYINRPMSAYRVGNKGSWSDLMEKGDKSSLERKWQEHYEAMERLYQAFDSASEHRYSSSVREAISREHFKAEVNKGDLGFALKEENRAFLKELPPLQRNLIRLQYRHPATYKLMRDTWLRLHGKKDEY